MRNLLLFSTAAMLLLSPFKVVAQGNDTSLSRADKAATHYRISVREPIKDITPSRAESSTFFNLIVGNVLETLVKIDQKGELKPGLAESWFLNFEGTELVFRLRKNVTFHDGTVFDCNDVRRMINSRPNIEDVPFRPTNMPVLAFMKRSVCLNNHEIKVSLKHPYLFSIHDFASPHAAIFDRMGKDFNEKLVGTGPFAFEEAKAEKHNYELTRYEEYWGKKPFLSKINVTVVPNQSEAINMILTNKIDLAVDLESRKVLDNLISNPEFAVKRDNLRLHYGLREDKLVLAFNYTVPLLRRRNLRCAIVYGINRAQLNEKIFYGKGAELYALQSIFSPYYIAYRNATNVKGFNDALVIMSDLRGDNEVTALRLLVEDQDVNIRIAEEIRDRLALLGLQVNIDKQSTKNYKEKFYKKKNFDLVLVNNRYANSLVHYVQSEHIYGSDKRQFLKLLNEAVSIKSTKLVSEARMVSVLKHQYQSCQHSFLLEKPIFLVSRGKYLFPDFHMPSSGINLSGIRSSKQ